MDRAARYVEGKHSATRTYPELQDLKVGDLVPYGGGCTRPWHNSNRTSIWSRVRRSFSGRYRGTGPDSSSDTGGRGTSAPRRTASTLPLGPTLSRSAYAAFLLQTAFLLALAVALRPLLLPAEVKAPVVAIGGIVASFATAWFLIKKVPGVSRVL